MTTHIEHLEKLSALRAWDEGLCSDEIEAIAWILREVGRLRVALTFIECEPINAEYIARAALDYVVPNLTKGANNGMRNDLRS